ncbi:MAG: SigB/SigF/SigG family RNA polymerase sigma factor [Clostridia bacterium]
MLEHEETMRLVKLAKKGDEDAKCELVKENSPLIKSIIKRFRNFGIEYEDLYQLGCVGFMKAVNNFDDSFDVRFSTYVVPMVLGEVKRFLRDDGYIKVSRALKVLSYKISRFQDDFKKEFEKEATISEIATHFGIDETQVVFALDCVKQPVSIYEKTDEDDDRSSMLMDKIADISTNKDVDESFILKEAIAKLDEREKKIIIFRYYRDMTQGEVAKYFGLSQVQISRLEAKIIEKLKKSF